MIEHPVHSLMSLKEKLERASEICLNNFPRLHSDESAYQAMAEVGISFEANQEFRASIPFGHDYKVHVIHVIPSIHKNRKLIIYAVYGKHKQWWHEFMCSEFDMLMAIHQNIKHK